MNWTTETPKHVQKFLDLDLHFPLARQEFYAIAEQTKSKFVEDLKRLVLAELMIAKEKLISDIAISGTELKTEYWPYILFSSVPLSV